MSNITQHLNNNKMQPGVQSGEQLAQLIKHAKDNGYALPAVNVIGTDSVNAVLETARDVNSPVMVQFSNGGAAFFAGLATGFWESVESLATIWTVDKQFSPNSNSDTEKTINLWKERISKLSNHNS